MTDVDVLVPTCDRPAALAVTLACLLGQTHGDFRVVVSDQGANDSAGAGEVRAVASVLRSAGHEVAFHRHRPRRGMAEHRHYLLAQAQAPYVLFLDDDVITEPDLIARLLTAIRAEGCGFVGSFVNAPSGVDSDAPVDQPPPDLTIEFWDGPITPEVVGPQTDEWQRGRLHFAAYLDRLTRKMGVTKDRQRLYKVAWVGGCVMFDTEKLRNVGGFSFWSRLPDEHAGEDVVAQLRVMAAYGGAAVAPSGAWHQEVPTTVPQRDCDAPLVLGDMLHVRSLTSGGALT